MAFTYILEVFRERGIILQTKSKCNLYDFSNLSYPIRSIYFMTFFFQMDDDPYLYTLFYVGTFFAGFKFLKSIFVFSDCQQQNEVMYLLHKNIVYWKIF